MLYVAEMSGNLLQPISWFSKFASESKRRAVQPTGLCFVSREKAKSGETAIRGARIALRGHQHDYILGHVPATKCALGPSIISDIFLNLVSVLPSTFM